MRLEKVVVLRSVSFFVLFGLRRYLHFVRYLASPLLVQSTLFALRALFASRYLASPLLLLLIVPDF